MLGKTFVGVSVLYSVFTIETKILSLSNVVGLKSSPLGINSETSKNIVIPVNKYEVRR